ncbi:hypothetical protein IFM89_023895 [Coptis chinensis]|uniref:beta-galactosidase n=1 Tax=Coptis chinensis TaxID=261450 RepID=A0A835I537_9MAGN|nr:hypothetical protein IFM89_023895 [Coptis chinensis]
MLNCIESDPPAVDSWKPNSEVMSAIPEVRLSCEQGRHVSSINFASFGTPTGQCGKLSHGLCYAQNVLQIVQEACIGREHCSVPVSTTLLGDPCPGVLKSLAVEALCTPQ